MAGGRLGAIAAGIVILLAGQTPGDAFVAQRAAAALNPGGPRLTIAAADNRTTFRMGERIPLVFTYDGLYSRADEVDMYLSSWLLNRDREFHRVEEIARRHGVTLKRP